MNILSARVLMSCIVKVTICHAANQLLSRALGTFMTISWVVPIKLLAWTLSLHTMQQERNGYGQGYGSTC